MSLNFQPEQFTKGVLDVVIAIFKAIYDELGWKWIAVIIIVLIISGYLSRFRSND